MYEEIKISKSCMIYVRDRVEKSGMGLTQYIELALLSYDPTLDIEAVKMKADTNALFLRDVCKTNDILHFFNREDFNNENEET